jgi:biopolymer transport protein ExbD
MSDDPTFPTKRAAIEVEVTADGELLVDGEAVNPSKLKDALAAAVKRRQNEKPDA